MSSIRETADKFVNACETGKGWEVCRQYCHPGATFSAQADTFADVDTVEGYTEFMKAILSPMPDGNTELLSLAVDEGRHNVVACGIFRGTHTGEGGPVPPTGKACAGDFVYLMNFEGDRIRHMTKVWNDVITLRQLGWM